MTVLVAAVSELIAANVVATCARSVAAAVVVPKIATRVVATVAASVAPVVANMLQQRVTVFVAIVIVINIQNISLYTG